MTKKSGRLASEIVEMADTQHRLGIMDHETHRKITVRQLSQGTLPTGEPITGEEIREIRENAHMSQGVFARHLHTTPGFVSKLERGETTATGPALVLLNVIRRKGIEVLR